MYVRKKKVNGSNYFQVVEAYRDLETGKVRHRNLASLGTCSTISEALAGLKRKRNSIKQNLSRLVSNNLDSSNYETCLSKKDQAKLNLLRRQLTQLNDKERLLKKLANEMVSVDTARQDTR